MPRIPTLDKVDELADEIVHNALALKALAKVERKRLEQESTGGTEDDAGD